MFYSVLGTSYTKRVFDNLGKLWITSGSFKSEQDFSIELYDFTVTFRIADTVSVISFRGVVG